MAILVSGYTYMNTLHRTLQWDVVVAIVSEELVLTS